MDCLAAANSFSHYDIQTVIKFLLLLNKDPPEIHHLISEALSVPLQIAQLFMKAVPMLKMLIGGGAQFQ